MVETTTYDTVLVERDGGVATVTLNRPDRHNALDHQMAVDFDRALHDVAEARAVVLTGAGGRAFSAGWDLKGASEGEVIDPPWEELCERLAGLRPATVAAIEGWCLGGGLALAIACDFRVATSSAKLGMPEVLRGIFPGMACTWRIPRLIGIPRARELMLLGQHLAAPTALDWGLVNRIAEPGEALTTALELAATLADGAPLAQEAINRMIDGSYEVDVEENYRLQAEIAGHVGVSADAREGISAFVDGRAPVFQGR